MWHVVGFAFPHRIRLHNPFARFSPPFREISTTVSQHRVCARIICTPLAQQPTLKLCYESHKIHNHSLEDNQVMACQAALKLLLVSGLVFSIQAAPLLRQPRQATTTTTRSPEACCSLTRQNQLTIPRNITRHHAALVCERSSPYFWLNPLATTLALSFSTCPSRFDLTANTHLD